MQRLTEGSLGKLAAAIATPGYDRSRTKIGIVHFGPGAFHRAHQAVMTDDAIAANGGDWAICGVSLRSSAVRDALADQQYLYTLEIRDEQIEYRIIGSVAEMLVAPENPAAVLTRLCDPKTRIATMTVTEKGYCLTASGDLDTDRPEIKADLASPETPSSLIGYLVAALARRRAADSPPMTVISCDNLSENGRLLRNAVVQFADELDKDLSAWISETVAFPQTMVDSITPATDNVARVRVASAIGAEDAWPIQREAFTQWVIEDVFSGDRPLWEAGGAAFTNNVAGYEQAKLRMLNGAHSALAYLGLLSGHETVLQAVSDEMLHAFAEGMLAREVEPLLDPPAGLVLSDYRQAILRRFANPEIGYQLTQIAGDSSQKIQMRFLPSIRDAIKADAPFERLSLALAGWLHFVRNSALAGEPLNDPLGDELTNLAKASTLDAASDIERYLSLSSVFGDLSTNTAFINALTASYGLLADGSPANARRAIIEYAQ
jgi:fructuronate reductase